VTVPDPLAYESNESLAACEKLDTALRQALVALCVLGQLRGRRREPGFEELLYPSQYLRPALRFVDRLPQRRASGHAVGEPRRELLHLALGSGHAFFQQHLKVGADHLLAVAFGGLVVIATDYVLLDLPLLALLLLQAIDLGFLRRRGPLYR